MRGAHWLLLAVGVVAVGGVALAQGSDDAIAEEWESVEGFAIERVATGLDLPTAVAVADSTDGKRYLVTELRGSIKSITVDGRVEEYAAVETFQPEAEFPDESGEAGLAGICVDPRSSQSFVTFAYRDAKGTIRNAIKRFDSGPRGFAAPPESEVDISGDLSEFPSAVSHQIGGCKVNEGALYVSVGDGWDVNASRKRDVLLGKILRLDYEGAPAEGNPFADDVSSPEAAVWAYGLRNPFGIDIVDDAVFVSNNGLQVDSLLRVRPGEDYLWDGTDESVALNALYVWVPGVSPVHLEYADAETESFPEPWRTGFFVAIAGKTGKQASGIQFIPYDPGEDRVTGPPEWVVRHVGSTPQTVTGLALDDDGLVFTAMLPDSLGETGLYRLRFDPDAQLPLRMGDTEGGAFLLNQFGCLGCHQYEGTGGTLGPSLDSPSLKNRLSDAIFTDEYEKRTRDLDLLDEAPQVDFKDARAEVLSSQGKERMRTWVKYRIIEPRFDRVDSQMPTQGISEEDAEALADFLIGEPIPQWKTQLARVFGTREQALWFAAGLALASAVASAAFFYIRRKRRRSPEPS